VGDGSCLFERRYSTISRIAMTVGVDLAPFPVDREKSSDETEKSTLPQGQPSGFAAALDRVANERIRGDRAFRPRCPRLGPMVG